MSHEGFNEIEGNDQGRVEKDKSSGERSQKCMSWLVLTWVPDGWGCVGQPGNVHWRVCHHRSTR